MRYDELAELLRVPDLGARMATVETALDRCLAEGVAPLAEPALRVLRGGGKRLRSALVVATANTLGAPFDDDVVRSAASVELVHQGSLVHDDVLDDADARRGVPTVNAVEGSDHAIIVGDYILAKAGLLAAAVSREVATDVAEVIEALSTGQILEMVDVGNAERTMEACFASIVGKTASLIRTSCRLGARCADVPASTLDQISAFGSSFGVAFQLIDDVLDLIATEELLGKPVGNDIRSGVFTMPVLLALGSSDDPSFSTLLLKATDDAGAHAACLELIRESDAIGRTIGIALCHSVEAADALDGLVGAYPDLAGLAELPEAYTRWALESVKAPTTA